MENNTNNEDLTKALLDKINSLEKRLESQETTSAKTNFSGMNALSDMEKAIKAKAMVSQRAEGNYKEWQAVQNNYKEQNLQAVNLYAKTFQEILEKKKRRMRDGTPFTGLLPSVAARKKVAKKFPNFIAVGYPNISENLATKQVGGPTGIVYTFTKGFETYVDVRDVEEIEGKLGITKNIVPITPSLTLASSNVWNPERFSQENIGEFQGDAVDVARNPSRAQQAFNNLQQAIKDKK